jgi:hypothetical protein
MGSLIGTWLFALENTAIVLGYVFMAAVVAPLFLRREHIQCRATKVGGIGFFLLCGLTHTVLATRALFGSPMDKAMSGDLWMHAIHAPQAIAVWVFVVGLYLELTDVDWRGRDDSGDERAGG